MASSGEEGNRACRSRRPTNRIHIEAIAERRGPERAVASAPGHGDSEFARYGRPVHPGRIECDSGGLRAAGVALLARDAKSAWAIRLGAVRFDGCDRPTGWLLEGKADIDFMFDGDDQLYRWVKPKNNPRFRMKRQAEAAAAAGRLVVWRAQTEKGFRGLETIANRLSFGNLSVVFDPH